MDGDFFAVLSWCVDNSASMKTTPTSDRLQSAAGLHPCNSKPAPNPDFTVSGGGTVFLFHPLTEKAKAWLRAHCPADNEHYYIRCALAVEHRYIENLIQLAVRDGLISSSELCK